MKRLESHITARKAGTRKKGEISKEMTNFIKKILVVDDEPEFTKTLRIHLKREGFFLDSACNGLKAQQKIEDSCLTGNPFDLVITDVVMPSMGGIELLCWIKEVCPGISVLVVSGFGCEDVVAENIRPGVDSYCAKPLTPQKMLALIDRMDKGRKINVSE